MKLDFADLRNNSVYSVAGPQGFGRISVIQTRIIFKTDPCERVRPESTANFLFACISVAKQYLSITAFRF